MGKISINTRNDVIARRRVATTWPVRLMSGGQSHTAYRLNLRLLCRFTPRNDNVVGVCGIIIGHEILITIMKMASGQAPTATTRI